MSLLEQYEQQYATLIAEITAQIGRLQFTGQNADRRELCHKIDGNLSEAQELLEQISLEIRELPSLQRTSAGGKLNCAKAELKRLQKDYTSTKDKSRSGAGAQLETTIDLGATGDGYYADDDDDVSISHDQRARLLDNSERIERTGNRLMDGYRVALETETLGAQVLSDLHHQRETIHGARARLRETNAELGRASRTLNSMMLRALREKAVLYVVGVCFVLAVGVSIYLSLSSSPTSSA